uniref:HYDIN/VesB/CFA65-like Ig-like domain-containing protein n=1 Tax=Maylandia zebra TaxID=106582 RepID=A0A3P9CFH9_9CICH
SVFSQEMLQSTEERLSNTAEVHPPRILELLDLSAAPHRKGSFPDIDQPLFQPYPSELVFQNFSPGQTYKLPLLLLNNDKVSRQVKLEQQNSVYFSVLPSSDARSNVAPGMSATFTVFFTPHENKDYHHRLVCVTEREKFEIPIRAIGPRAILDFRDKLDLPVCPVKASTEKTQLVCNVGNSKAKFRLHTERPFSVRPEFGSLDVGESMQVTVVFHPMNTGNHRQDLLLHYHTGEDVYISLHGSCEELNIHLEPDSIWMENTYVSLISTRTVSLTNHSGIPLQYCWTVWPSQQEEDLSLLRYLCMSTKSKFTIIFKPEEARLYQQTIYCDVTGLLRFLKHTHIQQNTEATFKLHRHMHKICVMFSFLWPYNFPFSVFSSIVTLSSWLFVILGCESPLPLTVKGKGTGPQLVLNYDGMNLKDLFIGFPVTVGCTLFNPSFVPVNFILRVLGDGLGSPSVSSFKQISDESLKDWQGYTARDLHPCPVEFTVSPAAGSVRSVSDVDIKVTLCSNTVRTYQLSLVVDVEGVGEEILTLPINARYINMLNVQTYSNKQLLKSFLSQQNESNMSYWAHLHRSLFSISLRLKIFFPLKRET